MRYGNTFLMCHATSSCSDALLKTSSSGSSFGRAEALSFLPPPLQSLTLGDSGRTGCFLKSENWKGRLDPGLSAAGSC